MEMIYFIARYFMYFFIPLLVVSISGMFSERSGVIHMGLDSVMVWSCMWGVLCLQWLDGVVAGQLRLLIALLFAGVMGVLLTLLLAVAAINLNADQTIVGMALNTFAPAFCIFFARVLQNGSEHLSIRNDFLIERIPVLADIPVLGPMFFTRTYITNFIGIAIFIISAIVLNKTRFGLRMCACGENPQAAESLGVNVQKYRYAALIIAGFIGGMGGLMYILPVATHYSQTVGGYGYLAMSVLIFGQWRSIPLLGAAAFFAFCKTIANAYSGIPLLANLGLPAAFYKSLPFIVTLIALAITSKHDHAPKASGQPYDKSMR
ncbi:MAG: ABC transporter permease [Erysipelotrichaceae bacterium]|nr:ABC transporter permease [Erysipelotrichaceae bacterium]MBQ6216021.1 ABC transporter permease [Erysipelotrichaceae bacterium]MBR6232588.1 ABC transporter permease [Erysipelotrichaceae bacterium]